MRAESSWHASEAIRQGNGLQRILYFDAQAHPVMAVSQQGPQIQQFFRR
jgi:hypothetical protein